MPRGLVSLRPGRTKGAPAAGRQRGVFAVRRLVTIDLPRRLSRRLPRLATEILVGASVTAILVLIRILLEPLAENFAPFALVFLAVVVATLVAGWRSGLVALLLGQGLIWYFVLPVHGSFELPTADLAYGLALSTSVQLLILLALALYQREVRAGQIERTRRINFLGQALREMDHRTRNNFQIVTSLLGLQANRSSNEEVRAALGEAAERLKAIAAVYDALAPSHQGLAQVRLQDQLEEICGQIRRGIMPDGVSLETHLEPVVVPHETAVAAGIVVNELVTNACKHAFPEGTGTVRVALRREGQAAVIEVADDGRGFPPKGARKGLGTRLVGAFCERMRAESEIRSGAGGTSHLIRVPLKA